MGAEGVPMRATRKSLCILTVLALGVAPALSGCAATETDTASAEGRSGLIGGFVEKLKREDDEAEVRELREHEPNSEEREEAREKTEQAQVEVAQAQEQEEAPQEQGEQQ
jgi:hypothetical protein